MASRLCRQYSESEFGPAHAHARTTNMVSKLAGFATTKKPNPSRDTNWKLLGFAQKKSLFRVKAERVWLWGRRYRHKKRVRPKVHQRASCWAIAFACIHRNTPLPLPPCFTYNRQLRSLKGQGFDALDLHVHWTRRRLR